MYGISEELQEGCIAVSTASHVSSDQCIKEKTMDDSSFGNQSTFMNKNQLSTSNISLLRTGIFILAGITLVAGLSDFFLSRWILVSSAVFFFLGITDFGRQCPIVLSVQHHINRWKSKNK
jgi:hypothetical protein